MNLIRVALPLSLLVVTACWKKNEGVKDEQINIHEQVHQLSPDSLPNNTISGNMAMSQIASTPNKVVLTGLPQHRLVTIYKSKANPTKENESYSFRKIYSEADGISSEEHFMPGIDLVSGYNMLNVAHYDLSTEKLSWLFDHPVLIKSLYYPSYVQDSLNKKPITRNFYLVSVYDADTNADTLINRNDLRRLYCFNSDGDKRIQMIPANYSVIRSQYDPMNDVVYIFARQDANSNGKIDKNEPLHIFWVALKQPTEAKRLY
jgi:hypothetical protein